MRAQINHPNHLSRIALIEQIPDRKEIAQALGHLLALDLQHLVVHPDTRETGLGMGAAALGDFIFVVGKLQIQPTAVNVERRPQQFIAHRRAFDMPAGTAPAPRAVPTRLVARRRLPQHKIHRVFFVGCHLNPRACNHVVNGATRQRAVVFVSFHPEKSVTLVDISKCNAVIILSGN